MNLVNALNFSKGCIVKDIPFLGHSCTLSECVCDSGHTTLDIIHNGRTLYGQSN